MSTCPVADNSLFHRPNRLGPQTGTIRSSTLPGNSPKRLDKIQRESQGIWGNLWWNMRLWSVVGVLEFFFGNHEKVIPELGWGEKNESFTVPFLKNYQKKPLSSTDSFF